MSGGTINIHGDPGQHLGSKAGSDATINLQKKITPSHSCEATINTTIKC